MYSQTPLGHGTLPILLSPCQWLAPFLLLVRSCLQTATSRPDILTDIVTNRTGHVRVRSEERIAFNEVTSGS
jgi:hypothetical protein